MSRIVEERVLAAMAEKNVDSFLIWDQTNVGYVSGYTADCAWILMMEGKKYMISDPRYAEQIAVDCPEYEFIDYRNQYGWSVAGAVAALAKKHGVKNLAFEEDAISAGFYLELAGESDCELVPVRGIVEKIRSRKTPLEIEYLRGACEIASRAFDRILKDIRVGVTEKELAASLSRYMVLEGADTQPYGNILISGARTSLLHGIPSSKALEFGDLVLMDYGCQFHGYLSDMTRTVVIGRAPEKTKEVYALVAAMTEAQEAVIRPGCTGDEAYRAGAALLKDSPYYPYHYNGVGHGIGRIVHEIPFSRPDSTDRMDVGTVTTVEPGIYIPGWGGIRIEDQVLVTEDGFENLITATKELIEL